MDTANLVTTRLLVVEGVPFATGTPLSTVLKACPSPEASAPGVPGTPLWITENLAAGRLVDMTGQEELDGDSDESDDDVTIDATDSAIKAADEAGINLAKVPGGGKDGRIRKEDVTAYLAGLEDDDEDDSDEELDGDSDESDDAE